MAVACGGRATLDTGTGTGTGTVTSGGTGGGAGAGPTANAGTTSEASNPCTLDVAHPGYVRCGPWTGYAWAIATQTERGSSITASDFEAPPGLPLCAKGVLAPEDDAVALIGFNVEQSAEGDSGGPLETWAITGTGLGYEVNNPGGSPLRIQIQGAKGYPDETWCSDISGTSHGSIPWSKFNTMCWNSMPPPGFDRQTPLQKVMLLVPGRNGAEQTFEVCLTSLYPY